MGFKTQEQAEAWAEQAELAADRRKDDRMLALQHTPGPWKAAPFRVQIPTAHGPVDGPLMSYLAGNKHTAQGMTVSVASERVADHRLCAAAPDLLTVAKVAYAILGDIRHEWHGRNTAEGQGALSALRDAIAKATGREARDVQDEFSMAYIKR